MNKCFWLCLCFICTVFIANGQEETIDTITISASSLRVDNFGGKTTSIDLSKNKFVAQALQDQTSHFIKNYGPGSLSTSSIRGGSAGHTLVLWNGLPIQNPFLGLLDLSLLDTWAMSKLTIQKGGQSAMWGSGAIGGIINLEQTNQQEGKLNIENELTYGSYNRWEERFKLGIRIKNLVSNTSLSYLQAENNFPYIVGKDTRRILENAQQEQFNFNQELYWTINTKNELSAHYWRSRNHRLNPPTTVQTKSEAYQLDAADRLSLQWKSFQKHGTLRSKMAYYLEDLDYFDPAFIIESLTHFETFIIDVDYQTTVRKKHNFNMGISHFRTLVSSPANYENDVIENITAFFARYRYKWLQLSARQELVDNGWIPFIPALEVNLPVKNAFVLKGKVSRNYRLPTLNDRFWVPGGNPELLPESGWSEEATLTYTKTMGKSKIVVSNTLFNRFINNWIQWTLEGAFNLNQVWSRGYEFEGKWSGKWENFTQEFNIGYNYILSTQQNTLTFPTVSAGDQLFYTPVHQAHFIYNLQYKNARITYQQQMVGATFGINENLDPFTIANLSLDYQWASFGLRGEIRNIWNTSYRIIERRPMPGRNYRLTILYRYNKK